MRSCNVSTSMQERKIILWKGLFKIVERPIAPLRISAMMDIFEDRIIGIHFDFDFRTDEGIPKWAKRKRSEGSIICAPIERRAYFVSVPSVNLCYRFRTMRSALLMIAAGVTPATAAPNMISVGAPTVIFDQGNDGCNGADGPDTPAIAFRNTAGQIVLYASSYRNIPLVGPKLRQLRKTCQSSFTANGDPDPAKLDDRTWLDAVYTSDGTNIFALGSAGYLPYRHNSVCAASDDRTACWYNGIVGLRSNDGGVSFSYIAPPPNQILFAPPRRYSQVARNPPGYFWSTNMVRVGAYGYVLIRRRSDNGASGTCAMRVQIGAWRQWQYWNGSTFSSVVPTDTGYTCKLLGGGGDSFPARGLYYHDRTKTWVAVYDSRSPASPAGRGIYYRTSTNLGTWSTPTLLRWLTTGPRGGSLPFSVAYPSLLDERSADRNFGHIGDHPTMLFMQYVTSSTNGHPRPSRQLVAIPVAVR